MPYRLRKSLHIWYMKIWDMKNIGVAADNRAVGLAGNRAEADSRAAGLADTQAEADSRAAVLAGIPAEADSREGVGSPEGLAGIPAEADSLTGIGIPTAGLVDTQEEDSPEGGLDCTPLMSGHP